MQPTITIVKTFQDAHYGSGKPGSIPIPYLTKCRGDMKICRPLKSRNSPGHSFRCMGMAMTSDFHGFLNGLGSSLLKLFNSFSSPRDETVVLQVRPTLAVCCPGAHKVNIRSENPIPPPKKITVPSLN